ncbi:hypothetical protein EDD17DRAFT_1650391 [Pisolithus thermaeus]|nr:hypothetical protein EDD17DRAFT_1650391 [Pisolithus thermaeus]
MYAARGRLAICFIVGAEAEQMLWENNNHAARSSKQLRRASGNLSGNSVRLGLVCSYTTGTGNHHQSPRTIRHVKPCALDIISLICRTSSWCVVYSRLKSLGCHGQQTSR